MEKILAHLGLEPQPPPRALASAVYREQIDAHQGRIVDTASDSVLAVFEIAAGAVAAALAVQATIDAQEANADDPRRLRLRIGVHLGDVLEKADGSVYGGGVNIAARLQALAESGGITISDAVRGAVRGKLHIEAGCSSRRSWARGKTTHRPRGALRLLDQPLNKKLLIFVFDSAQAYAWAGDAVSIDGEAVGELSSAG